MRDVGLKPRDGKELPPEKLFSIMANIWGDDTAAGLLEHFSKPYNQDTDIHADTDDN